MIDNTKSNCNNESHTKTFINYAITICNYPLSQPKELFQHEEFCSICDKAIVDKLLGREESKIKFSIKCKVK